MTKEEKLQFIKQSYRIMETLVKDINEEMSNAKEGVAENSAKLIIGSLADIDKTAQHLKNLHEAMEYIHIRN
jgi:hypothetical protein